MIEKKPTQTRRNFLFNLGIFGAFILSMGLFFKNIWLYLFPERGRETFHKYLVCNKGEIPVGKAEEIKLGDTPVFVVHLETGYKVYSGVCTHLGCIVRWEDKNGYFFCPCHKGYFDKTGDVIMGPPPGPLDEFKVEVDGDLVFVYVRDKKRGPWS